MSDDEMMARFAVEAIELGPEGCAKKLESMPQGRERAIFKNASFCVRYGVGPTRLKQLFEKTPHVFSIDCDFSKIKKRIYGDIGGEQ